MRIFVTGGTGMLGSHVAERLRERGDEVVALIRSSSDTRHLESIGCELVVGDMGDDPTALATKMRGADAVVHSAAKVFQAGDREAYLRVNVGGTERVLEAAALAAPRVVHVSSVAVYSGLPMDRPLTEGRWIEADPARQNSYPASKHISERAAWRLHDAGEIRLTTVRPSVIYGERDRAATPLMVRYASLPLIPLIGGGRNTLPLVYAGNVADGVIAALDHDISIGRPYNLALDRPITARELVSLLADALGRKTRVLPIPGMPLRALAALVEHTARAIPGIPRPDARRAIRSLTRNNPYDSTRARLELGWKPAVGHEEGVRRTMAWWRTK